MSAADWPTEAREAAAFAAGPWLYSEAAALAVADRVLAALAPHVQPLTEDWEWGVRHSQGRNLYRTEQEARQELEMFAARPRRLDVAAPYLIRRRPASEWEVAT